MPAEIRPGAFIALVGQLTRLGVELPDEVLTACQVCADASTGVLTQQAAATAPVDLLSLTRDELAGHIRDHALTAIVRDRLNDSAWQVSTAVLNAGAHVLRDHADEILDQLRPQFTAAAKAVHAATKLGIRPGTTPTDVLDLGTKAITAWRSLPESVATLDEIAAARIAMADVLTIEPMPNPFGERQYGAAFSPTAPRWSAPGDRTSFDKWLRLSQDQPLTLLAVDEVADAAHVARVIPPPIAEGNAHIEQAEPRSRMVAR